MVLACQENGVSCKCDQDAYLCPYCPKSIFWNKIWKRERKKELCVLQIMDISRPRLSPQALLYCLSTLPCLRQATRPEQHFLPPTSIVSTLFAEFSRKMRSQWVSGGQGLTRCQGSSWKSHQADGKKWEKRERRNGRGKIRLGREIKMFSPSPSQPLSTIIQVLKLSFHSTSWG